MSPIELYNELRFKGYFDYNLFKRAINQYEDITGEFFGFRGRNPYFNESKRDPHIGALLDGSLVKALKMMDGYEISMDSFVDSDNDGNEVSAYILLEPKRLGDNWYMLELYFYSDPMIIEIVITEPKDLDDIGVDKRISQNWSEVWAYDKDKPLENILLNWVDTNPLEVKQ